MKCSKSGQITIFVIVGIVILLVSALVLYVSNIEDYTPAISVPSEVRPVHDYVTGCLDSVGRDGLLLLGEQGGYIYLPDEIDAEQSYLSPDGTGIIKIPYWYYRGSSRVPKLGFMEQQHEKYIENNLRSCLNNFSSFSDEYEISEESGVNVDTRIDDEGVKTEMNYHLEIQIKGENEVKEIRRYIKDFPVDLKSIHNFANQTMNSENEDMFLEETTVDFMAMHPDIPFTGLIFYCGTLNWEVDEIKEELQDLLYYNYPRARFKNVNHTPFEAPMGVYEELEKYTIEDIHQGNLPAKDKPSDAYDYFNLYWETADSDFDNLDAKVLYNPRYGMDIRARPSVGGMMTSNSMQGASEYLSFLCINLYHFTYDVEYPVIFSVRDFNAFKGEGYTFKFASPVIIDHNEGKREALDFKDFTETSDPVTDYCGEKSEQDVYITAKGVKGGYINQPLKNVNIKYDCIKFICDLGTTDVMGGSYRLRTNMPTSCTGGFVEAAKDGYLTTRKQYDGSNNFEIVMPKLKDYNVSVVKNKDGKKNAETSLRDSERVLIHLVSNEYDYSLYEIYDKNSSLSISLIAEDTNYTLDMILMDEDSEEIVGGYRDVWETELDEMLETEKLKLHVTYPFVRPAQHELLRDLYSNETYKDMLEPEFKP